MIALFFILAEFDKFKTEGAESKLAELFLNLVIWVLFYKWAVFMRTLKRKLPETIYGYLIDIMSDLLNIECLKKKKVLDNP